MKAAYAIVATAAWVNGLVWLFHDGHYVWGTVCVLVSPGAMVYGAGHLMGAW